MKNPFSNVRPWRSSHRHTNSTASPRRWIHILFLFVLTCCLGNYYFLSRHQHQQDMESFDMITQAPPNLNHVSEAPSFKKEIETNDNARQLQHKASHQQTHKPVQAHHVSMEQLQYAPNRIPGYIHTGNDTLVLYGHVMREFTRRICARQIAQSNILVISPESPQVSQLLENQPIETDQQEASLRRQIQHKVGGSTLIHAHRQGHTHHAFNAQANLNKWKDPPGWILLAMLDHQWQNDAIMANAIRLFQQSTVTYVVVGIGAATTNKQIYGDQAILQLLQLNYKVQILSQSHFPTQLSRYRLLEPNRDVTRHTIRHIFDSMLTTANQTGTPVHGYVFATQGLDLAIPTATAYTPTLSAMAGVQYKQCPTTELGIRFNSQDVLFGTSKAALSKYRVVCQGQRIKLTDTTKQVWKSGETVQTSEAICARAGCGGSGPPKAACTTRILQKKKSQDKPSNKPNLLILMIDPISRARFERSLTRTNKLIQMLNFTSFQQYTAVGNNSGPNQAALYSGMPLKSRESIANYHSHQKTQWLWDTLRDNGYATFKAEDGCVENSNMIQSIQPKVDHGDALVKMMCFDFQRPNCIGGTAAAKHLVQYGKQFIETYQEANQPWAAMMHFIDSHEDTQMLEGTLDDPIWRFLYEFYHIRHEGVSVFDNTLVALVSDHGLHYGSYVLSPRGLKERSQPMLHLHLPKAFGDKPQVETALATNRQLHTTPFDVYETILDVLVPDAQAKGDGVGSSLLRPLPKGRKRCATTKGIPPFVCVILKGDPAQKNALMPGPPSVMSFYADIPAANKITRPLCPAIPDNSTIFTKKGGSCLCSTNKRKWYPCTEHPWAKPTKETLGEYFSMVDCEDERSFEIQVQRDPKIVQRPDVVQENKRSASSGAPQKPNVLFIEVDSVSSQYADRHLPRTRELLNSMRLQKSDKDPSGFTCQGNETLCAVEFTHTSVVGPSSIPNQIAVFGACTVTVGPERCKKLVTDAKNRTMCTDDTSPVYDMQLINRLRTSATFCPLDGADRSPWIFDIAKSAGYVTLFAEEFCYDGSIYVPQGNIFPLNVDIEPGKFFCQAARLRAQREDIHTNGRPAWQFAYHSNTGEPNCIHKDGGYEGALVALDHVETMWNSYHDMPKLAYVNAIAAHMYADFREMAENAETYDLILSSFLKRMLARADASNTILVVRADHGLQGGPMTSDYSIQIEALRPWTEVIVPKQLPGLFLNNLFENQQRLVTGFDFYKTLTASIVSDNKEIMPDPPEWTNHLWQQIVSETRTCADARASNDHCLFEGQRTFSSPNLRCCNLVEENQQMFCPLMAEEFVNTTSEIVDNSFHTTNIQEKVCPRDKEVPTISPSLASIWKELDGATSQHTETSADASSDSPPPGLAAMLTSIVSDLAESIYKAENRSLNVCQTGFGQGHSAALFLDASPNVFLRTFAKLNHATQTPLLYKLLNRNRKRTKHSKCDSCLSMLEFERKKGMQCDVLHGLAATSNGYADTIVDLVKKAPCGVILTSAAARSLRDERIYFGSKSNQWTKLRDEECIDDIHCFADMGSPTKKFCMAVTTGKCQYPQEASAQCTTKIAEVSKRIVLSQLCPAHELMVPVKKIAIHTTSTAKAQSSNGAANALIAAVSSATKKLTRLDKKKLKTTGANAAIVDAK